jgi:hypothetical protein
MSALIRAMIHLPQIYEVNIYSYFLGGILLLGYSFEVSMHFIVRVVIYESMFICIGPCFCVYVE